MQEACEAADPPVAGGGNATIDFNFTGWKRSQQQQLEKSMCYIIITEWFSVLNNIITRIFYARVLSYSSLLWTLDLTTELSDTY